jgi:hypothetical protein
MFGKPAVVDGIGSKPDRVFGGLFESAHLGCP